MAEYFILSTLVPRIINISIDKFDMDTGTIATRKRTGRLKAAGAFAFSPRNLGRYPRLDTVLMAEQALYDNRSGSTITEIWKLLPKKVMWTTYTTILDYLEYSGKIQVEKDKTVTWLWNAGEVRRILANPKLVVR